MAVGQRRAFANLASRNVCFRLKTDGRSMFAAPSFLRPLWLGSGHYSASSSRFEKNQTQPARDLKDSGPTAPVVISAFGRKRFSLVQGAKNIRFPVRLADERTFCFRQWIGRRLRVQFSRTSCRAMVASHAISAAAFSRKAKKPRFASGQAELSHARRTRTSEMPSAANSAITLSSAVRPGPTGA